MSMVTWEPYIEAPPPTAADFERLEQRLGVRLPDDYKQAASAHAGQTPRPDAVPAGQGSAPFGVLLSPADSEDEDVRSYSVAAQLDVLSDWGGERAEKFAPISDTTGHELICLDYRESAQPAVALVNLDYPPDDARAVIRLAGSFSELLGKLRD